MKSIVKIEELSIGYNSPIIAPISATINSGELIGIIGRNGQGKSTLLKTLAGIQPSISGSIKYNEKELSAISSKELSKLIGLVLTNKIQLNNTTVYDFVAYGRYPYTNWIGTETKEDKIIIEKAISLCEIEPLKDKNYHELSDGEKQKVNIARVIAQNTPIILLDEPTAHLDLVNKLELFKLLKKLSTELNKSIIISTHQIELALQLCDTIWMIAEEKCFIDEPKKLISDGQITKLFAGQGIVFNENTNSFDFS